MNYDHIIITLLLFGQAVTLSALWAMRTDRDAWRRIWTRDTAELLFWKRHAVLRDPKSGKYVRKDRR